MRPLAGIVPAARIETRAGYRGDELAPQLQVLRLEVADRHPHVMAIEAAERFLDHRILRAGHTGYPRLRAGIRHGLHVPAQDRVLPGRPGAASIVQSYVVQL